MVIEYGDQVWSLSIMIKYNDKKKSGKRTCENDKVKGQRVERWKGDKAKRYDDWGMMIKYNDQVWWSSMMIKYDD